jgi:hypothetical protein
MGGRGSGRYPSFGSNASLCEHALAIYLATLKRDGYLFTGCAGKITSASDPKPYHRQWCCTYSKRVGVAHNAD